MTYIYDAALKPEASPADVYAAVEALNAESGQRIVFQTQVAFAFSPHRVLLFLEPEATPHHVEGLQVRLAACTTDGQLRSTHLSRQELAA